MSSYILLAKAALYVLPMPILWQFIIYNYIYDPALYIYVHNFFGERNTYQDFSYDK